MTDFEIGYFVQFDGHLCSIIAVTNGIAKLSNDHEVACNQLCPIIKGDPLDKQITLVCDYTRFLPGDIEIESKKYYQDCYILQAKAIRDFLKQSPSIIHLLDNTEDFRLANKLR